MSEERLTRLENEVVNLRVRGAEFNASLEGLTRAVGELKEVVQDLRDTMNQGRGAIWVFGIGSGILGGVISFGIKRLFGP